MKFGRALREVVRFEILYKLFILCLVNPVMREIYQTYISSVGVSFNARIVGIFLNLKGAFIFLLLFFTAAFLIFFELSVVVRIVALCPCCWLANALFLRRARCQPFMGLSPFRNFL